MAIQKLGENISLSYIYVYMNIYMYVYKCTYIWQRSYPEYIKNFYKSTMKWKTIQFYKWAQHLNKHHKKENRQMTKPRKWSLTLLVWGKCKLNYKEIAFDHLRIVQIENVEIQIEINSTKYWWDCEVCVTPLHCCWECKIDSPLWETPW